MGLSEHGLTYKQEKFCEKYVELNGNGTQAAIAAGYTPENAGITAAKNLKNSSIRQTLAEIAQEVGLSVRRVLGTVNQALDAEKPLVVNGDVHHTPDWQARLRASELGLKVHGLSDGDTHNNLNVFTPQGIGNFIDAYYQKENETK